MIADDAAVKLYDQLASAGNYYSSGRPVYVDPEIIVEDICSKMPLTENDRMLDVGCGTGVLTIPLARRCGFVDAMDAGKMVIKALRKHCKKEGVMNVRPFMGDALCLPFPDGRFDRVLIYSVLHYLENGSQAKQCVKELIRVCKPGGKILLGDIPDPRFKQEFEGRRKTKDEKKILENFDNNRKEFDRILEKHVRAPLRTGTFAVDSKAILDLASRYGCKGRVCRQDIRLTFSLTRRDILLVKDK
jgi:ubiquinone/menaquinone biosynthesis C-methylase UbiE